jgi:light-regulated signal transduction histidine kinase (bacteriophytochrome)
MKEKSSMAAAQHKPDLSSCASEPIHVPGAIQPYGVLIATESDTWRIEWVSANIEHCLGVAALHAIGLELAQLIGEQACAAIESTLNGDSYGVSNLLYLSETRTSGSSTPTSRPDHHRTGAVRTA